MGKLLSVMIKPIKNYNIESRLQKYVENASTDSVQPAPKHASTTMFLQQQQETEAYKEALRTQSLRNDQLLTNLRDVYVVSTDTVESPKGDDSRQKPRNLPVDRTPVEPLTPSGIIEPTVVPEGKVTLTQAAELIKNHNEDPEKMTPEVIANNYKLDMEATQNVLRHFHVFELYVPPNFNEDKSIRSKLRLLGKVFTPEGGDRKLEPGNAKPQER